MTLSEIIDNEINEINNTDRIDQVKKTIDYDKLIAENFDKITRSLSRIQSIFKLIEKCEKYYELSVIHFNKLNKVNKLNEANLNIDDSKETYLNGINKYIESYIIFIFLIINSIINEFKSISSFQRNSHDDYELFLHLFDIFQQEIHFKSLRDYILDHLITHGLINAQVVDFYDDLVIRLQKKEHSTSISKITKSSRFSNLSDYTNDHSRNNSIQSTLSMESSSGSSYHVRSTDNSNDNVSDDLWKSPDFQSNEKLNLYNAANTIVRDLTITKNMNELLLNSDDDTDDDDEEDLQNEFGRIKSPTYPPPPPPAPGPPIQTITHVHEQTLQLKPTLPHRPPPIEYTFKSIEPKILNTYILTKPSKIMIIDIRSHNKFSKNHLSFQNLINIDPYLIFNSNSLFNLYELLKKINSDTSAVRKLNNLDSFQNIIVIGESEYDDTVHTFIQLFNNDSIDFKDRVLLLAGGWQRWLMFKNEENLENLKNGDHYYSSLKDLDNKVSPKRYSIQSETLSRKTNDVPAYHNNNSSPSLNQFNYQQRPVTMPNSYQYDHHQATYSNSQPPPIPQQKPPLHPTNNYGSYGQLNTYSDIYANPNPNYNHQQMQPHIQYQQQQQYLQHHEHQRQLQQFQNHQQYSRNPVPAPKPRSDPKQPMMESLAICGLKNLGSTCYVNSMIQGLSGISIFKNIFLNLKYKEYLKPANNETSGLNLSNALSSLLRSINSHGGCSIMPTKFLRTCNSIRPDFRIPNEQQDSQEFLLFILDRLHKELNLAENVALDYPELLDYKVQNNETYSTWHDNLINQEGLSPITAIFQGEIENKLLCNKCGFESPNYSTFSILSLSIPQTSTHRKRSTKVHLNECINYYRRDELLSGENAWDCPNCSKVSTPPIIEESKKSGLFKRKSKHTKQQSPILQYSDSIKSTRFIKLPKVLIIHLSRFLTYDLTEKLDTVITYPLILNIDDINYKLVGLINHYGNLKSGHYTSLINKSKNADINKPYWCYFDDEEVKQNLKHGDVKSFKLSGINSRDVYVLFYEKIN